MHKKNRNIKVIKFTMCFKHKDICYVLKLKTPDHWYVGTTSRAWHERLAEHKQGTACRWTKMHPMERVHRVFRIPHEYNSNRMENEVTLHFMRHVAKDWRNVKGGDYTWSKPFDITKPAENFWVPEEFGGQRRIDY